MIPAMMPRTFSTFSVALSSAAILTGASILPNAGAATQTSGKFDFGPGNAAAGFTQVLPNDIFNETNGFGFEPGASVSGAEGSGDDPLRNDACGSGKPFYFSAALPEGNYKVTVTLGDPKSDANTTIKAELRRLMLLDIRTAPGQFATRTFTVNIRTPKIAGDGAVHLKSRERGTELRAWDDKLTLEFNGPHPSIAAMEIEPAPDLPTVYILGDSTVCDQPLPPWNSWGQMLPFFFKPDVVVANNAESGETLRSSLGAKRLAKVLSTMKQGDYLLIQYGHNDMKDHSPDALETYKQNLKRFVEGARQKGGTPVLITSMERKAGVEHPTLEGYPDAVREVAKAENVTLIDLNAMSKILYKAIGPNLDKAFVDGTHHDNYGSYELAQCIVQGIAESGLGLAKEIVPGFKGFDPAQPDPLESVRIPVSPGPEGQKPLGN